MQQSLRLDDWDEFVRSVRRARITHLVIAVQETNAGRHGFTFRAGQNEYAFGRRLASEYSDKLATFEELEIYRVRPPSPLDAVSLLAPRSD